MTKGIGRSGALVAMVLVTVSCGASANKMAGPTGDGGTCPIGTGLSGSTSGSASWKDDGTPVCGFGAQVARTTATMTDSIQIVVSSKAMQSVDIVVSSYAGPLGGTYSCQPGDGTTTPKVMFDYVGKHGGGSAKMSDCSVTLGFSEDSAGRQHAQGTFSGTVLSDAIDGGTYAITDGTFDLTVTRIGG